MKKLSVAALLTSLLSAGVVVPAHAAEPTDPAPANVQISWKDDTHKFVHVTWTEDGSRPNRVYLRPAGGTTKKNVQVLAADAPNEIDLPTVTVLRAGIRLVVGVTVGTAEGETSPAADSPAFDTIDAGAPKIVSFKPYGTSTLQVTWKQGASVYTDTTPGDPLDLDGPVSYQPMYRGADGVGVPIGPPTSNTSISFAGPKPPYRFYVQSVNEWTAVSSQEVQAEPTAITASIPTWVVSGNETVIRTSFGDPVWGPAGARVTLQARNTTTSPWYAVASGDSSSQEYQFNLPSVGTRQYRIAVANAPGFDLHAFFGGYSAPVTTTVQQKTTMVVDNYGVVRNYEAWGTLYVKPAVTGTVALQRWNGKTWVFVKNTALKTGVADFRMSSPTVGTFVYRYYVPAHTNNGLPVAAAYSTNFTIKVFP
jgi:hypothetical protein